MKTSIENRNNAFKQLIEKFALRKRVVYKIIESYGSLTDFEIAEKMKLPINSITGRRKELEQSCLIKEVASKKNDKTNITNTIWSVTTEAERVALITSKLSELIKQRDALYNDLDATHLSKFSIELINTQLKTVVKLIKGLEKLNVEL